MYKIEIKLNDVITNENTLRTYEECELWYNATKSVFPENHTFKIRDITKELEEKEESIKAIKFLADTDYLIIRMQETGIDYPEEIKQARAIARTKVRK